MKIRDIPKFVYNLILIGVVLGVGSQVLKKIKDEKGIKVKESKLLRYIGYLFNICLWGLIIYIIVDWAIKYFA